MKPITFFAIGTALFLISIAVITTQEREAIKSATVAPKTASESIFVPESDEDIEQQPKLQQNGKKTAQELYVERFHKIAQAEHKKFGIPASIKLAQGILESRSGQSEMAIRDNNHFGIKCKDKCKGCRCANYADDSEFDMFRIFGSAWESYREHSILLSGAKYKHLKTQCKNDFRCWAYGLKKAGYATNPHYATALIALIKKNKLYRFDNLK